MTAPAQPASHNGTPDPANPEWSDPVRLEVIVGSVRPGRFGPVVANWFVREAGKRTDLRVGLLDLIELDSPNPPDLAARIDAADAVVVVTPEYNHSYPGPLKTAIDSLGSPWRAKAVGFVSYGGLSSGLRAVEPLRVVFAELHAVTVRETVSFHLAAEKFDAEGEPKDPAGPTTAAHVLLDQVVWWSRALRAARSRQPY